MNVAIEDDKQENMGITSDELYTWRANKNEKARKIDTKRMHMKFRGYILLGEIHVLTPWK